MIVTTDAHYLRKEDRYVHKAYLNSKGGEREVDSFYEYAYLQDEKDIISNLKYCGFEEQFISNLFANTIEIYDKISSYTLLHSQQIPEVEVLDYPKENWNNIQKTWTEEMKENYPILQSMFTSEDKVERYWVNQCWEVLRPWEKCPVYRP